MRSSWIVFLSFIIVLTSAVVDPRGSVYFESEQMTSAPQFQDAFDSDSLYSANDRFGKNSHVIAQEFIPIVIIADAFDYSHHFNYYLPLYELSRKKDYFLLI